MLNSILNLLKFSNPFYIWGTSLYIGVFLYIWISFRQNLNYIWKSSITFQLWILCFRQTLTLDFCFLSLSATFDFTFGSNDVVDFSCVFYRQLSFLLWNWREYSKTVIFIVDFQIDWWNWTGTCFFILFFFWINRCEDLLHDLFVFIFCFCLC